MPPITATDRADRADRENAYRLAVRRRRGDGRTSRLDLRPNVCAGAAFVTYRAALDREEQAARTLAHHSR
jgi:hypothetical protein